MDAMVSEVTVVCEGLSASSSHLQPWKHVLEICKYMIRKGVKIRVMSDADRNSGSCEVVEGVEVRHVPHLLWLPILDRNRMIAYLGDAPTDVVMWCGKPLSCVPLARLLRMKKPIVWMLEAGVPSLGSLLRLSLREVLSKHHRFLLNDLLNALLPRFLMRCVANSPSVAKILAPSEFVMRWLLEEGISRRKIEVVQSTLDAYYKASPASVWMCKQDLQLDEKDLVIAYMGSPCTIRGADTLIRSIGIILAERTIDLKCLMLSRRPIDDIHGHLRSEEEYLIRLVGELGLGKVVEIVPGMLDRKRLSHFIQASDVVAFPFKLLQSEIPLSVLEAMSLGKVIITTRIRTLQDIVAGNRGILVESGRPHELARAILNVIDRKNEMEEIVFAGRRYASSLPSWDAIGQKVYGIIQGASSDTHFEQSPCRFSPSI